MRYKLYITLVVLSLALISLGFFDNQRAVLGLSPSMTPETEFVDERLFYRDFLCPELSEPLTGPNWGEITVGVSSRSDLESYIATRGEYITPERLTNDGNDSVRYILNVDWEEWENQRFPVSLAICTQDDTVTVIIISTLYSNLTMENFLSQYGIPDRVQWTDDAFTRGAFWFDEGVGVELFAANPDNFGWGRITHIIYFPYQSIDNYHNQYPFNRLSDEEPIGDSEIVIESNPFAFDMTIQAMTAQPSFTPSPTFTPIYEGTPTPQTNNP